MQNNDFTFDSAFKKKYPIGDDLVLQNSAPELQASLNASKSAGESTGFGSSLGTPEMMTMGPGLQVLGQYLDAPYKE